MQEFDTYYKRLSRAVESSFQEMRSFRALNTNLVKEYAGSAYGEGWGEDKLVHKLGQAVDGYMMLLAADRPAVLLTTENPQQQAFARLFQDSLNTQLDAIDFESTVKRWVMDGLFCIGITRAHIGESEEREIEFGVRVDTGDPTASNVSIDNAVLDMAANSIGEMQYAGERYRIPFQDFERGVKDGTYTNGADKLKPTSKRPADLERLEDIGTGKRTDDDELEPMIDLADIWSSRDRKIRTYPVERPFTLSGDYVAEMKWTGAKTGPYEYLLFNLIPEKIMPSSQVAEWMPMDQAINNLMRQQNKRAVNLKENPVYTPEGVDTAKNVDDARDMQWVKSTDPKETRVIRTGGADANTQALIAHYLQQFDEGAGNLTSLLGLGAQSDTVGQEQLIHSAGNRIVGRMQSMVTMATTRLVRNIAKLLWDDEFKSISNRFRVPGTDYNVESNWEPGKRQGKFSDYKINVYSMPYRGPAERMATINQLITQIYVPLQQTLSEQGGAIDMAELSTLHSELLNTPRLKNVITFDSRPREPLEDEGAKKSPFSSREYVRKSSPGNPQRQAEQVTQMMTQNSNGDQQQ